MRRCRRSRAGSSEAGPAAACLERCAAIGWPYRSTRGSAGRRQGGGRGCASERSRRRAILQVRGAGRSRRGPWFGPIPANVEQRAEDFVITEPTGRVLALNLPVEARRPSKGIVPTHQRLDKCGVTFAGSDAPAQERADPGEAVPLRAIGKVALPCRREHVRFRQQPGVIAPGGREQVRQLCDVLATRVVVAVAACELVDECRSRGLAVP